tara:strand:- start:34 stop:612 length:579 start_codon:yes stop_codon:yes gene_type:complete
MKKIFLAIILLMIFGCSNTKIVYWCGDHPCINKKEREAYFKKTMIVEVKEVKKSKVEGTETKKIIEQARLNEKKRIRKEKDLAKQARIEEKRRIAEEKALIKQAKLEEKQRIAEEKALIKQAKLEEKNLEKKIKIDEKKLAKKRVDSSNQESKSITKMNIVNQNINKFTDLAKEIFRRNSLKPYPDINDIQN